MGFVNWWYLLYSLHKNHETIQLKVWFGSSTLNIDSFLLFLWLKWRTTGSKGTIGQRGKSSPQGLQGVACHNVTGGLLVYYNWDYSFNISVTRQPKTYHYLILSNSHNKPNESRRSYYEWVWLKILLVYHLE